MPHNETKPSTSTPSGGSGQTAVEKRLETMEALLVEQRDLAKKTGRLRGIQTILLLCLVVVVGWGMLSLNRTVSTAVEPLPTLIEATTTTVEQTGAQMQQALEGLNEVDFEALNESVQNLQAVTESLRQATSFFSGW